MRVEVPVNKYIELNYSLYREATDLAGVLGKTNRFTSILGAIGGPYWDMISVTFEPYEDIMAEDGILHYPIWEYTEPSCCVLPTLVDVSDATIKEEFKLVDENNQIYEYGYFPQTLVSNRYIINELNNLYNTNELKRTGNIYHCVEYEMEEYEYRGEGYVSVIANRDIIIPKPGEEYQVKKGQKLWFKVEPIQWQKKGDKFYSKKILISNMAFAKPRTYEKPEDFPNSEMCKMLNEVFLKEIQQKHVFQKPEVIKPEPSFIKTITINDILEGNYNEEEINNIIPYEKYEAVLRLTHVDEEHVEQIREFVTKLGSEYVPYFDVMWIKDDPVRNDIITKIIEKNHHTGGMKK